MPNLYSFLMAQFGEQHKQAYGSLLTPVQASIRRAVETHQYTSFSAPTSAGKSYSIRDCIAEGVGDAVVVVPSRALIAEYVNTMRAKFGEDKAIMISPFVDLVYTSRDLRRIFILTPERSKDLYQLKNKLNVRTFFFDEAQTSEEAQRGIVFDVTVRRVKKHFPAAKIIFAHPFVDNPQAQFSKHGILPEQACAQAYSHGSVGRICVFRHANGTCYYFSPYLEKGHHISNSLEFPESFKDFALRDKKSILVYVSIQCRPTKPRKNGGFIGGLYLEITPKGSKLWRLKYRFLQKKKKLSIGKYPIISLAEACNQREEARQVKALPLSQMRLNLLPMKHQRQPNKSHKRFKSYKVKLVKQSQPSKMSAQKSTMSTMPQKQFQQPSKNKITPH